VSFNGVAGRALLSLFQQSYKGFKGKFLKIRCNKREPTLLDGFPLYWTEKPRFQGARCLEDMPQQEREVCLFFSSLKVVSDTATLISQEFSLVRLKAYIGILHSLALTDVNLCVCLLIYLCSLADNMLGKLNKKDLVARAKKMKAVAQASFAKDLKLKTVVEVVPSDDEETYYGFVFKRRRNVAVKPAEHSTLDGRAPSPQAPLPSPPPSRDIVV